MTDPETHHKRMILGLPANPRDYSALPAVAELARLLGAELIGTFAQDQSLLAAAALPFVRELRAPDGWQKLSADQLAGEMSRAAAAAERLFTQATQKQGSASRFHSASGSAAEMVRDTALAEDIIAIIEPRHPADRITQQFLAMIEAAYRCPGPLLLMPHQATPAIGAVIALIGDVHDPALQAAINIAASAKEELLVVPQRPSDEVLNGIAEQAKQAGIRASIETGLAHQASARLIEMIARLKGRLAVMQRNPDQNRSVPPRAAQMPLLLIP